MDTLQTITLVVAILGLVVAVGALIVAVRNRRG